MIVFIIWVCCYIMQMHGQLDTALCVCLWFDESFSFFVVSFPFLFIALYIMVGQGSATLYLADLIGGVWHTKL